MAVALTGMLYLMVANPWANVFACSAGLGWLSLLYCDANSDAQARREEVMELEKQVVVLRSTLQEMAVMHDTLESRVTDDMRRRMHFRWRGPHSLSSSSL
jgi:hypothetical protein